MNNPQLHPVLTNASYATVILPLAAPKPYTYLVSEEQLLTLQVGMRVEVQFGRSKLYAALVIGLHKEAPKAYKPKPILSLIDQTPVVLPQQIELWKWIASYYCCTLGEVMNAALPAGLKLASETRIVISPIFDDNFEGLSDKEYMIAEALRIQNELSIDDVRKILGQKTVYPLITRLLDRKLLYLKEELKTSYKPKIVRCVRLQEPYRSAPDRLEEAFELLSRSTRQVETLMAFIQLDRDKEHIRRQELYKMAQVDSGVIDAIVKKGVFEAYERNISRLGSYDKDLIESHQLSAQQERALVEIRTSFKYKEVCLLHGVTGSGKTRVYIELIQEALDQEEQVLYLLPEIALTAQIVGRLQRIFGDQIAVYHSRLNNNERVELWRKVLAGSPIILGARSSLFLPFRKLRLIIVDEEHDTSFKQMEPAPRYNARDTAIYLAHLQGAKVLLGTATPAIESYHNALKQKYALVEMKERFGGLQLPETITVDALNELKKKLNHSHFTSVLIKELKAALERGEQAILFQNRRGYAPTLRCKVCNWHSECVQCDVSLTYHKFTDRLRCHYCGYSTPVQKTCPACGSHELSLRGFGTEKIEDELQLLLPDARIARMDFDTVKGKHAHARLINEFEERRLDVLVGTQMVTKGLDFDNVGVVGVLSADQLLQFPDFRSSERAFQLITQVSGRAGRKNKRGKVIIQAFKLDHPIIREVQNNAYTSFFHRELEERKLFAYPPFSRLIKITLKHRKPEVVNEATKLFTEMIKSRLGKRVKGPAIPGIPRIRNYFLLDILVKLETNPKALRTAKQIIAEAGKMMQSQPGFSTVRLIVDVDPN
ncbi:MAG: primosomal protein N' [Bacteroidota bacterium]